MNPSLAQLAATVGLARGLPLSRQIHDSAFPGDFDENAFVDSAIRHKVTRSALEGLKLQKLSLGVQSMARLREHSRSAALRAALSAREAAVLQGEFTRRGIASMVIKGPAAAMQLYGNLEVREFYDLDIVVDLQDAAALIPAMEELGLVPQEDQGPAPPGSDDRIPKALAQRCHHIGFIGKNKAFRVEIHDRKGWEAEPFGRDNLDDVFSRSVSISVPAGDAGMRFQAPCPADHAAILIAHGTQHAWCLLHWLLDAAAIFSIREPGFQASLAETLQRCRITRQAKVASMLASEFYAIEFSKPMADLFVRETARLEGPVRYARARLEKAGADLVSIGKQISMPLLFLSPQVSGIGTKLKLIFSPFKIPSGDLEALPLPKALWFGHIVARPFFVLSRRIKKRMENKE